MAGATQTLRKINCENQTPPPPVVFLAEELDQGVHVVHGGGQVHEEDLDSVHLPQLFFYTLC